MPVALLGTPALRDGAEADNCSDHRPNLRGRTSDAFENARVIVRECDSVSMLDAENGLDRLAVVVEDGSACVLFDPVKLAKPRSLCESFHRPSVTGENRQSRHRERAIP